MFDLKSKIKKAVVLLSGGIDSSTVLAIAAAQGYEIYCLSFNYGQKQTWEIKGAKTLAEKFKVKKHLIIDINLKAIGGSALTDDIAVPKRKNAEKIAEKIPVTYVPARNTIFLSYALAWAEVLDAVEIFVGVNAVDYSGYPDCRPEFISAFEKMANLATKISVEKNKKISIKTPLINMTKGEIIRKGLELNIDYSITHSCYDPAKDGRACDRCDSCLLREKGFKEAGVDDPALYSGLN